nr:MAG TPA: hypothetical protein [Caudoviricetes sp.]
MRILRIVRRRVKRSRSWSLRWRACTPRWSTCRPVIMRRASGCSRRAPRAV